MFLLPCFYLAVKAGHVGLQPFGTGAAEVLMHNCGTYRNSPKLTCLMSVTKCAMQKSEALITVQSALPSTGERGPQSGLRPQRSALGVTPTSKQQLREFSAALVLFWLIKEV